ncbi:MAG: 2-amino-4-hydroxy-6-hydroxymethyldihydropteridine diphosphokinase [Bacteroidetes bacterium]|nr:2-amino-4-hydroxy-6-hydroxymethyldihydropteridine diphosphokinase [Bacteroidota bacterium]
MNKAYLLTGSNMGDRENQLATAQILIQQECGKIMKSSSIYETAAWGKTDQPSFLNQALFLETTLSANQLMNSLLKIEEIMGRTRKEKYGPRFIDIDILLFNHEIHSEPFLKLPHPELQNRRFALLPLAELAPKLIHPVLHKNIKELLKICIDTLDVKKYS